VFFSELADKKLSLRIQQQALAFLPRFIKTKSTGYRHVAKEWWYPDRREAIHGLWIPAIHAGMT